MSATMVSAFYEVDVLYQQNRKNLAKMSVSGCPPMQYEPKLVNVGCQMSVNSFPRARGFSTSIIPSATSSFSQTPAPLSPTSSMTMSSAEAQERANRSACSGNINSSRYKTELCRPFEENGHCKYGDKCQFAHGAHELRSLARHPKYKTELCRTFHTVGFCPYGPRCHFIHNEDERKIHEMKTASVPSVPVPQQRSVPFAQIPQIVHSQSLPIQRQKPVQRMSSVGLSSIASDSPSSSLSCSPQNNFFEDSVNSQKQISTDMFLWLLNQRNNAESLVRDEVFSAPPSPPSSPVHSSTTNSSCNSPVSDKGLRLPIFRRLSLDDY